MSSNALKPIVDARSANNQVMFGPVPAESGIEVDPGSAFVACSAAMREVRRQIEQLASVPAAVLVVGESGTGREIVARMLHGLSKRGSREIVKLNCGALPPELLEAELYGCEAGALNGISQQRVGKFEAADGGTLLLEDIGSVPFSMQSRLLHTLQQGEFVPIGAGTTRRADVRVIATGSADLRQDIQAGRLRSDLYYCLNTFTIQVPPLRERGEDIPQLLSYFMGVWSAEYGRARLPITERILTTSLAYGWPGNVRELENFIKRYVVLADEELALSQLDLGAVASPVKDDEAAMHLDLAGKDVCDLKSVVRDLKQDAERAAILQALERTQGNKQEAASLLHISLRALHYKVRAYGIESSSLRSQPYVGFPDPADRLVVTDDQPSALRTASAPGKVLTMARSTTR